jgi:hypothetical protein
VSIVKFHLFYGLRKNRLIIQRIKAHRTVLWKVRNRIINDNNRVF